jgi:ABC-2 type transport system permease protein
VAFGMLLMNTPTVIVLYFLPPVGFEIITDSDAVRDAVGWLDFNQAMVPLSEGTLRGRGRLDAATVSMVWIVIPLVLGSIRLIRREVK